MSKDDDITGPLYAPPKFAEKTEQANARQIGGDHYKGQDLQHWDYCYARGFDCFQYIISKWVERWRKKGGIEDLRKARHALDKYIELAESEEAQRQGMKAGAEPGRGYVDQ